MDSLLALTLFQYIQHWIAVLVLCLAQSELQYEQWHLKGSFLIIIIFLEILGYIIFLPYDEISGCLQTTCASVHHALRLAEYLLTFMCW